MRNQIKERIQSASLPPTLPSASSSYIPPSQRPGSEAALAAALSDQFTPPLLSSIDSSLLSLPTRPNAPGVSASIHTPSPGPATHPDKGKGRAASVEPDLFKLPNGRQGFQDQWLSLLNLQGPIRDALSIASMENRQDATIGIPQLQNIDRWLNFHLSLTSKAEKSLEYCPPAATLPPYPALGLAWTAMANDANSIDMPISKLIHSLVNSITIVNVNKAASREKVPVPIVLGI